MLHLLFVLSLALTCSARIKSPPIVLTDGNWTKMLDGEWMVKFFAPWCPACRAMKNTWQEVAGWGEDLDIHVAMIDVSENPGLSGRFLVTALPTIYHVKSGKFRIYQGSRGTDDFVSFVDDKKWKKTEALPWYKAPDSLHMSAMGLFFKFSMQVRNIHTLLTESYGIPFWGSYLIFALATVVAGLLLGVTLVLICDLAFPPKPAKSQPPPQYSAVKRAAKVAAAENKGEESDMVDDTKAAESSSSGEEDEEEEKEEKKEEKKEEEKEVKKDKDKEKSTRKRKGKAKKAD